jgi:hypothetical protein
MIDLTDLQEDILTLAVKNPEMTNEEIADVLDCSPNWVSEVRRKYEYSVDESQVGDSLNTVRGNAQTVANSSGGGGLLDFFIIMPLELSLAFTVWALETGLNLTVWTLDNTLKLSVWLLDKMLALSIWLLELPFRILGGPAESNRNDN